MRSKFLYFRPTMNFFDNFLAEQGSELLRSQQLLLRSRLSDK